MDVGVVEGVRKIAVLRALVLGDLLFSLPAFDALHQTYPDAEIFYLGRPWHLEFVPGHVPGVSRVVPFAASPESFNDLGYLIHPNDYDSLLPALQAEKFDIAVQLQGGGLNSNPLVTRLNPRVSVGSREPGALPLDRWILYDFYQNETMRSLEIVSLVGAATTNYFPRLPVLDSDRLAAAPFLRTISRPYVIIHPGARDLRRCWSPEKYAAVADECKRTFGMEIVLTGSHNDMDRVGMVSSHMSESPLDLGGKTSLPALVGLIAQAQLVISNDTGPLHLALAVGQKAVGLFWDEYITKSMPLTRDGFHPLVSWVHHCPACGKYMDKYEVVRTDAFPCPHLTSFVNQIESGQVVSAAEQLLSASGAQSASPPVLPPDGAQDLS